VKVVDRAGKVRELSGGYWGLEGMAWAPDGRSVYYSGGREGGLFSVYRATLDGEARIVSDNAGTMTIHDVAKDGTWAVTRDDFPTRMFFRAAGSDVETDLSWLDSALGPVLSRDGKTLLFTDQSGTAGVNYGVGMRSTSGGPIVRLGEGSAEDISMDGKSALATVRSTPPKIVSYPTGVGKVVQLDRGQFENVSKARWLPGEARILVSGNLPGGPSRGFVLDPATHEATPVGPEGVMQCVPSPAGKTFIALSKAGWAISPLTEGGEAIPVPSMTPEDYLIRWDLDGSAVFAYRRSVIPAPVDRIDLATGKRETVMTLSEGNSVGRVSVPSVAIADDMHSVTYSVWDYSSVLFTVKRTQ